jgi:hypothetical protein
MEQSSTTIDPTIAKLLASIGGALVSMNFVKGTWMERLAMVASGAALSYYSTEPIADWVNMAEAEGLVGFLVGLFGMAIVARVYEAIQALDVKQMASDLWKGVLKRFGLSTDAQRTNND